MNEQEYDSAVRSLTEHSGKPSSVKIMIMGRQQDKGLSAIEVARLDHEIRQAQLRTDIEPFDIDYIVGDTSVTNKIMDDLQNSILNGMAIPNVSNVGNVKFSNISKNRSGGMAKRAMRQGELVVLHLNDNSNIRGNVVGQDYRFITLKPTTGKLESIPVKDVYAFSTLDEDMKALQKTMDTMLESTDG